MAPGVIGTGIGQYIGFDRMKNLKHAHGTVRGVPCAHVDAIQRSTRDSMQQRLTGEFREMVTEADVLGRSPSADGHTAFHD